MKGSKVGHRHGAASRGCNWGDLCLGGLLINKRGSVFLKNASATKVPHLKRHKEIAVIKEHLSFSLSLSKDYELNRSIFLYLVLWVFSQISVLNLDNFGKCAAKKMI